jgi:Zn-finger nucleic acid-binding protein
VWLDRGELDKIIERAAPTAKKDNHSNYFEKPRYSSEKDYHYKKKKGLLGDLFDF